MMYAYYIYSSVNGRKSIANSCLGSFIMVLDIVPEQLSSSQHGFQQLGNEFEYIRDLSWIECEYAEQQKKREVAHE